MEIQLKPHHKNQYPIGAILLKGNSVLAWLKSIQEMGIALQSAKGYPIPGTQPNTVWACLLIVDQKIDKEKIGKHALCQNRKGRLFIPENTNIYPQLSDLEFDKLFEDCPHFMHPSLGLIELKSPLNWEEFLVKPIESKANIRQAKKGVSIPSQIKFFEVVGNSPDEMLKDLEGEVPNNRDLSEKPLTALEKVKLKILKNFFEQNGQTEKGSQKFDPSEFGEGFQKLFKAFKGNGQWFDKMKSDFEDLSKRNQQELDKLMDLFKKDPKEALKYAIPLDDGAGRGPSFPMGPASFSMNKRWLNFSLFGSQSTLSGGRGGSMLHDGVYNQLRDQYKQTAKDLIQKGDYYNAAFVYLKLLKDHHLAAQTLEDGQLYPEAAAVHLKYTKNKSKAAACYEKARMYSKAIDLYKEVMKYEKVGDLYVLLNQKQQADEYYYKIVGSYNSNQQYLKASLILRHKIGNSAQAQEHLLKGWQTNRDAFNCLNNYFTAIEDKEELEKTITKVYREETNNENLETFLKVIRYEYEKAPESPTYIRDMAYEIISKRAHKSASILSELKSFNQRDQRIMKDVERFRNS